MFVCDALDNLSGDVCRALLVPEDEEFEVAGAMTMEEVGQEMERMKMRRSQGGVQL